MNRFVLAIDLGREVDPTTFALVDDAGATLDVLLLDRFRPVREDMSDVIGRALEVAEHPRVAGQVEVLFDACGVGRDWSRLVRGSRLARVPLFGIIPVGNSRSPGQGRGGTVFVPKVALAGALHRAGTSGRVRFAKGLRYVEELRRELEAYTRKASPISGVTTYANDRRSDHDDLVSAVAMALWWTQDRAGRGVNKFRPLQEVA